MRHTGLRTRVKRLEKRLGRRRPLSTIITGIYPEEQPGPIIGIAGDGKRVRLKAGETLRELKARAVAELPGRFLQVLYAATAASERASEPSPAPTPADAPEAAPRPVPGVGRVASRDELIRAGAIPVPPERIV